MHQDRQPNGRSVPLDTGGHAPDLSMCIGGVVFEVPLSEILHFGFVELEDDAVGLCAFEGVVVAGVHGYRSRDVFFVEVGDDVEGVLSGDV